MLFLQKNRKTNKQNKRFLLCTALSLSYMEKTLATNFEWQQSTQRHNADCSLAWWSSPLWHWFFDSRSPAFRQTHKTAPNCSESFLSLSHLVRARTFTSIYYHHLQPLPTQCCMHQRPFIHSMFESSNVAACKRLVTHFFQISWSLEKVNLKKKYLHGSN